MLFKLMQQSLKPLVQALNITYVVTTWKLYLKVRILEFILLRTWSSFIAVKSKNEFAQSSNVFCFAFCIKNICWHVKIIAYCTQHGNTQLLQSLPLHGTDVEVIIHNGMVRLLVWHLTSGGPLQLRYLPLKDYFDAISLPFRKNMTALGAD